MKLNGLKADLPINNDFYGLILNLKEEGMIEYGFTYFSKGVKE